MKVILNSNIHGLGEEGDIVEISSGYARNYVLPQKKGVEYNAQNASILKSRYVSIQKRKQEQRTEQSSLKDLLDQKTFSIKARTNENGQLYGAVNSTMIVDLLKEQGIEIQRRQVYLQEHTVKSVGSYEIETRLYHGIEARFTLVVESENYSAVAFAKEIEETSQEEAQVEGAAYPGAEAEAGVQAEMEFQAAPVEVAEMEAPVEVAPEAAPQEAPIAQAEVQVDAESQAETQETPEAPAEAEPAEMETSAVETSAEAEVQEDESKSS